MDSRLTDFLIFFVVVSISMGLLAQEGIGTDEAHRSAALEINSVKRGLLIPRVALTALSNSSPISETPAESLLVYNTANNEEVSPGFYYWENGSWKRLLVDGDVNGDVEAYDLTSDHGTISIINGEGSTLQDVQIDITPSTEDGQVLITENGQVIWSDISLEGVDEADLELEDGVLVFLDGTDGENRLLNGMAKIGIADQGIAPIKLVPGSNGQILKTEDGEVVWDDLEEITVPSGELSSLTTILNVLNGENATLQDAQIEMIAGQDGQVLMTNNDIVKWSSIDDLAVEPWLVQEEDIKATDNDQNIYQEGNVAIGKTEGFSSNATLDVAGSIAGGNPAQTDLGDNSIAVGDEVIASGKNSMAIGYGSEATAYGSFAGGGFQNTSTSTEQIGGKASGKGAFAFGRGTKAEGDYSVAMGRETTAQKISSLAFGANSYAQGNYSIVMGQNLRAYNRNETVIGRYNAFRSGASSHVDQWIQEDPLFEIGNGSGKDEDPLKFNNALTVLKKGWTGIGIIGPNNEAKPTEMLDIGNNPDDNAIYADLHKVKVRDLPRTEGDITGSFPDKVVTVDADGVLRSVVASELVGNGIINAGNNLTVGVNNKVILGDELIYKTEINTASQNLNIYDLMDNAIINENTRVVIVSEDGTLKKAKSMMPKYFHMPAVFMPLVDVSEQKNLNKNISYKIEFGEFVIDLYEIYKEQFKGSTLNSAKSPGAGELPALNADQLNYYITYFDEKVFANVNITNEGVLTYKIYNAENASARTYMNIVYEIRD